MKLFPTTHRQHQSVTIRKLSELSYNFRSQWSLCCCMFLFSVRAGRDKAAGEPAEDSRVCPCEGQPEANAGLWAVRLTFTVVALSRCPPPSWRHVIPEYLYIHRPPSSVLSWSPAYIEYTLRYVCPTQFRMGLECLLSISTKIWRTICFCCYGGYFLYIFLKYVLHFLINVSHIMTEGLRLEVIWLIDKLTCPVIIIH